jgi:hypothetical protein
MEDSKKKPIMIGVIVVCLGVAGAVTLMRSSGGGSGIDGISDDKMTWVKCSNPSCKAEYEMSTKALYEAQKERLDPMARGATPLTCEKCSKDSLFQAVKCVNPSCGIVFIRSIAGANDLFDRCPKCGQSEIEESRKRRLSGQE